MHKSYSFYSHGLNKVKYNLLKKKALQIRVLKNMIGALLFSNMEQHLSLGKTGTTTAVRATARTANRYKAGSALKPLRDLSKYRLKGFPSGKRFTELNNKDIEKAIFDVYGAYELKYSKFLASIKVQVGNGFKIDRYKIAARVGNAKKNKGDVKNFEVLKKSTTITKVVSYLVRYWNSGFGEWLKNNLVVENKPEISEFRTLVLSYLDGPQGHRIEALALSMRARLRARYFSQPITFKALTFNSSNQLKVPVLRKNKTFSAEVNAFLTIGAQKTKSGKICIPTKHSKSYHGKISEYRTKPTKIGSFTTSYTIQILSGCQVRVILTKEVPDDIYTLSKENILGVDVNIKNNLFALSDGEPLGYEIEIVKDFIGFLKKKDAKLKHKKTLGLDTTMSLRDKKDYTKHQVRVKDMLKRVCSKLVSGSIEKGYDHIVMEDLGVFGKMSSISKELELNGYKYSRLVNMLGLSDLKKIVESICQKKGAQFSLVHPEYTSQTCTCGCIEKANRITQEVFKCVACGHTDNADDHSARNIKARVSSNVLRTKLLLSTDRGFRPKPLKRHLLKSILQDYYSAILGGVG